MSDRKLVCSICGSFNNLPNDKEWRAERRALESVFNYLRTAEAVQDNLKHAAQRQFNFVSGESYILRGKISDVKKQVEARQDSVKYCERYFT